jgi:hypothetical protein
MEAVNKQARQEGRKMNSEEAIFANIIAQRQLIQKASSLSKQRRQQENILEVPPNSAQRVTPDCDPSYPHVTLERVVGDMVGRMSDTIQDLS